ncbi:MAG: HD domain-containing protein [Methanomassiliicoccales archaeon]
MPLEFEKFIRDPLYGFIGLTKKEIELLETRAVQRLRRIKQLGNTHLVYPSACHTRFEHSLGVLHVATRMAKAVQLDDEEIEIVRYAGILHDVGHGPLSHNFESVIRAATDGKGVDHETITRKIITEDGEINSVLGDRVESVLSLFDENTETAARCIISSNIDADRLDYLMRDSYHIGVAYGIFDIERILHTLSKEDFRDKSYIVVSKKGMDALEGFLLARHLMHTQVYNHHVRLISDEMLIRGVQTALRDHILDNRYFDVEGKNFVDSLLELDDDSFFSLLKSDQSSKTYDMVHRIERRKLLKRSFEADLESPLLDPLKKRELRSMSRARLKSLEEDLADESGCDQDFIIACVQEIKETLYSPSSDKKSPILIKEKDGRISDFDERYCVFKRVDPLRNFYVFCPAEFVEQVRSAAERKLEIQNGRTVRSS